MSSKGKEKLDRSKYNLVMNTLKLGREFYMDISRVFEPPSLGGEAAKEGGYEFKSLLKGKGVRNGTLWGMLVEWSPGKIGTNNEK